MIFVWFNILGLNIYVVLLMFIVLIMNKFLGRLMVFGILDIFCLWSLIIFLDFIMFRKLVK